MNDRSSLATDVEKLINDYLSYSLQKITQEYHFLFEWHKNQLISRLNSTTIVQWRRRDMDHVKGIWNFSRFIKDPDKSNTLYVASCTNIYLK